MHNMRCIMSIIQKDLLLEIRMKEVLASIFIFGLLVILIFNFAFSPGIKNKIEIIPGILWVAFIFSGTIGLNRSFQKENNNNCLDGLLLSPVDKNSIYLGKMLSNLIFMLFCEAIILPVFSIFFNIDLFSIILPLSGIIFLGTLGFVIVGTLFAGISENTRSKEILLPILLLPIVSPVIVSAVKSTKAIFMQIPLSEVYPFIKLLISFDIIFLVLSLLVFDYIVEQ